MRINNKEIEYRKRDGLIHLLPRKSSNLIKAVSEAQATKTHKKDIEDFNESVDKLQPPLTSIKDTVVFDEGYKLAKESIKQVVGSKE